MKLFKRALSLIIALSVLLVMFSFLAAVPMGTVSAVTTPEGYEIAEQVTLNFNTEGKGWSGTNEDSDNQLSQVTDPDDSSNKYMQLTTTSSSGYNFELANGSDSTTAYEMEASTKYSIEFKVKVASGTSSSAQLSLCFGSKAAYDPSVAKPYVKSWSLSSYNDGNWHTVSYEWTTTETMQANTYGAESKFTNICNRLYFVARSAAASYYIDDVVITKYKKAPDETVTIDFNTEGKGWSGTNEDSNNQLSQVTDPDDSSNKYMQLSTHNGSGYNFELATGSDSTTAYVMEANTKYTISFKFKVISYTGDARLSLNFGTQAAYSGSLAKPTIYSWYAKNQTADTWINASYEWTTTETMQANTYGATSSFTNVCNRLYFVAQTGVSAFAIDDVVISKYSAEEPEKEMYTIPDFTHEPYKTYAAPGQHNGVWYCSLRWSTYTDGSNSVIRYKFAYDISENAASTSGSRGITAMGTNGGQHAMMCLVDDDNPSVPINVTQGKSYKITFKYKVTEVEPNSFVSFNIMRGKYSSKWTGSTGIASATNKDDDRYVMAVEYSPTVDWVDASYTFTADFTSSLDSTVMQIGGAGYGDALIDDITIEEIDASEVEPVNNDAANYVYTTSGSTSKITSYKGTATDLTVTTLIGRRQLVEIGEYAFLYNRYTKNIIIENGPTTIGDYAFEYAKVLETVSIPASVTSIGKGAFFGIRNMKSITVDAGNANYKSVDGVLYNKDMTTLIAYPAAKTDTTFTVPSTVTTIAEGAFYGATNLTSIVLPEGLTTIGRRAFMNCTALTSVNIASSVTSIGSSAFRDCAVLTSDDISIASTATVGENAFYGSATYTVGNVDAAGSIDVLDGVKLAKYLAGRQGYELDHFEKLAADINSDGTVDNTDLTELKRYLAGWNGYDALPYTGVEDATYDEYTTDSETPELVVNLSEQNSRKVTSKRDINYDPNKEDVIIVLITGQSNSGNGGYTQEYQWKYTTNFNGVTHPDWEITAEPDRPAEGTVFYGATVTELTSSNDVYNLANPERGASTMGGYAPAMGKALNEATGAKVVFVYAAQGAVGMHEWTPEPENYECACGENGGGKLYANAIANFTKSYQALDEDYNIIATAYVYNQGEHEEHSPYATASTCTVHDDATYYQALMEMHEGFLSECEIDCGGMYMPRSYYARYSGATDIEQNSRRPSYARTAMYRAAQEVDNFFIFSNVAEQIYKGALLKPDPSNSIHYSMIAYNYIGRQNADSLLKYFGMTDASEFTGITVFNKIGVELCEFDAAGNLVSGSDVVEFSDNNSKLYIRINPTGTMYTLNYSSAGTDTDFVSEYCVITQVTGQTSFKIVINPPVK